MAETAKRARLRSNDGPAAGKAGGSPKPNANGRKQSAISTIGANCAKLADGRMFAKPRPTSVTRVLIEAYFPLTIGPTSV